MKLFITDFEDTLIDSDGAIPLSTMIEIDRMRKDGIQFGVCSGKILKTILDYNRDFPFLDYIICCHGAFVYDVINRKVLFKKAIGGSIVKRVHKLYHDKTIYFSTGYDYSVCHEEVVSSYTKNRSLSFLEFYDLNKDHIYKMDIVFDTKKERDSAYDELYELGLKATFIKSKKKKKEYVLEIVAKDVNKTKGLEKICKTQHISLDDVCFVGTCEDDIPIFLSVGISASLSNGCKKLKKVASMESSSNDTKGVEKVIKKLI